jgi:hypothetical protein
MQSLLQGGSHAYATHVECDTPRPVLSILSSDSQARISWEQGTLQHSPRPTGPWVDLPEATSPFQIAPSETSRFFRLRLPCPDDSEGLISGRLFLGGSMSHLTNVVMSLNGDTNTLTLAPDGGFYSGPIPSGTHVISILHPWYEPFASEVTIQGDHEIDLGEILPKYLGRRVPVGDRLLPIVGHGGGASSRVSNTAAAFERAGTGRLVYGDRHPDLVRWHSVLLP